MPSDHENLTLDYYAGYAAEYAARTNTIDMSSLYPPFVSRLDPGSVILDLGCGSGRDARYFASLGHHVFAVDPCLPLLREARRRCEPRPQTPVSFLLGSAPGIPIHSHSCRGVWASASLLHLPREQMGPALWDCKRVLQRGGSLAMSVKQGQGSQLVDARWFTYWEMADLVASVIDASFSVVHSAITDSLDGSDTRWLYVVAEAS